MKADVAVMDAGQIMLAQTGTEQFCFQKRWRVSMDERLKKQLDFALEIDKEKDIFRQTHLSGHGRNENE